MLVSGRARLLGDALALFGRYWRFWLLAGLRGLRGLLCGHQLRRFLCAQLGRGDHLAADHPGVTHRVACLWTARAAARAGLHGAHLCRCGAGELDPGAGTDWRDVVLGGLPVLIAAFAYPAGLQLVWEARVGDHRQIPHIEDPALANTFVRVLLLTLGSLPFWLVTIAITQPPPPCARAMAEHCAGCALFWRDRHQPIHLRPASGRGAPMSWRRWTPPRRQRWFSPWAASCCCWAVCCRGRWGWWA